MAEALGIAASGIAVAQLTSQVGGAVLKLKQLWDEVKDVPEDIADLMEQIDCLDPVLWETENNFNQGGLPSIVWDRLASKRTTTYCRKALHNLTQMVDELSLQINNSKGSRRKIAAVKVLLKKDLLKKLEKRLENAVRMLTLAQQSYLVTLTQVQPDIIVQKFTALAVSCSHAKSHSTVDLDAETEEPEKSITAPARPNITNGITRLNSLRHRRGFTNPSIFGRFLTDSDGSNRTFLFQAPIWLSRRSWEVHSMRAAGAWQWNLRSYSIIPVDSRTIGVACNKSPKDMQELFDAGLASPYDQSAYGRTLLYFACLGLNLEMVKYLVGIGLGPLDNPNRLWYPRLSKSAQHHASFLRALVADRNIAEKTLFLEDEDLPSECLCSAGTHDFEIYKALLPYQCPLHQSTSLESRIRSADYALEAYGSAQVVRFMLQPEWNLNPRAICTARPLILPIANALGPRHPNGGWDGDELEAWLQFAAEVIHHTPDIHFISSNYSWLISGKSTAFTLVLFNALNQTGEINEALGTWLRALRRADVDLNTYGEYEHQLLANSELSRQTRLFIELNKTYRRWTFRIVGFTYGPQPEDWEVFWNEPTDHFVGQFWRLVENPPLHIPGSWVDDPSDSSDYSDDDDDDD
ncbi:hypothetical protein Hte_012463 [Hypoxylon texense]